MIILKPIKQESSWKEYLKTKLSILLEEILSEVPSSLNNPGITFTVDINKSYIEIKLYKYDHNFRRYSISIKSIENARSAEEYDQIFDECMNDIRHDLEVIYSYLIAKNLEMI